MIQKPWTAQDLIDHGLEYVWVTRHRITCVIRLWAQKPEYGPFDGYRWSDTGKALPSGSAWAYPGRFALSLDYDQINQGDTVRVDLKKHALADHFEKLSGFLGASQLEGLASAFSKVSKSINHSMQKINEKMSSIKADDVTKHLASVPNDLAIGLEELNKSTSNKQVENSMENEIPHIDKDQAMGLMPDITLSVKLNPEELIKAMSAESIGRVKSQANAAVEYASQANTCIPDQCANDGQQRAKVPLSEPQNIDDHWDKLDNDDKRLIEKWRTAYPDLAFEFENVVYNWISLHMQYSVGDAEVNARLHTQYYHALKVKVEHNNTLFAQVLGIILDINGLECDHEMLLANSILMMIGFEAYVHSSCFHMVSEKET